MRAALVKLSYCQGIDASVQGAFERSVIDASYKEFLLKSQAYNPERKYSIFSEMVFADGRANSLHYKCSFPVAPYVELLKNNIPALTDNSGRSIKFNSYEFKLIESDITNIGAHKISITYTTDLMTVLDNIEDYLILAYGDRTAEMAARPAGTIPGTFLLKIVPGLCVCNYEVITLANYSGI